MRRCDKCSRVLSEGSTPECADPGCPLSNQGLPGPDDRTLLDPDALDRASVLRYAANLAKQDEGETRLDEGPLDVTKLYDDDEERPAFLEKMLSQKKAAKIAKLARAALARGDEDLPDGPADVHDETLANQVVSDTRSFGDADDMGRTDPEHASPLGQSDATLLAEDVMSLVSLDDLEIGRPTQHVRPADVTLQVEDDDIEVEALVEEGDHDTAVNRPRLTLSELRASLRNAVSVAHQRTAASMEEVAPIDELVPIGDVEPPEWEPEFLELSEADPAVGDDYGEEEDRTTEMNADEIERVAASLDEATSPPMLTEDGTMQLDQDDLLDAMHEFEERADFVSEGEGGATVELSVLRRAAVEGDRTRPERKLDEDAIEAAIALAEAQMVHADFEDSVNEQLPYGGAPAPAPYVQGPQHAPGPPGYGYPPQQQHPGQPGYPPGPYPNAYPPQPGYPPQTHMGPPAHGPGVPAPPAQKSNKVELFLLISIIIVAAIAIGLVLFMYL